MALNPNGSDQNILIWENIFFFSLTSSDSLGRSLPKKLDKHIFTTRLLIFQQ